MKHSKKIGAAVVAAGVLAGMATLTIAPQIASAKTAMKSGMKMKSGLSELDKAFVKAANGGNLAEVAWYPVVTSHTSNAAAKQFAARMKTDHAKANAEVVALCARKGVKLPHKVAADEQTVIDRLKQEKGAGFDAAYQHEMVRDHIRDIEMFEREISIGRDLAVKAYATKTLVVLKEHLQMAKNMVPVMSAKPSIKTSAVKPSASAAKMPATKAPMAKSPSSMPKQ